MDKIQYHSNDFHDFSKTQEYTKSTDVYNNANYLTNHKNEIVGFEYEGKKVLLPQVPGNQVVYSKEDVNEIINNYASMSTERKNAEARRAARREKHAIRNPNYKVKKIVDDSSSAHDVEDAKSLDQSTDTESTVKRLKADLNMAKLSQKLEELNATADTRFELEDEIKSTNKLLNSLDREKNRAERGIRKNRKTNTRPLEDINEDIRDAEKMLAKLHSKRSKIEEAFDSLFNIREPRTPGSKINFRNLSKGIRPAQARKRLSKLINQDPSDKLHDIEEEEEEISSSDDVDISIEDDDDTSTLVGDTTLDDDDTATLVSDISSDEESEIDENALNESIARERNKIFDNIDDMNALIQDINEKRQKVKSSTAFTSMEKTDALKKLNEGKEKAQKIIEELTEKLHNLISNRKIENPIQEPVSDIDADIRGTKETIGILKQQKNIITRNIISHTKLLNNLTDESLRGQIEKDLRELHLKSNFMDRSLAKTYEILQQQEKRKEGKV